jgi:hypothetical protein
VKKTTLLAAMLLVSFPCAAQMYKCVDKKGVTHYTDVPLPGCKGGEADDSRARAQAEASLRAAAERRCSALRLEHARLSSASPLAQINADGERVYLPEELKDQRLAEVREAMRACP